MEEIKHITEIKKVLARGRSLFNFRGVMKLYKNMNLDERKALTFIKRDEFWKHQDEAPFCEFILIQYRRHQVGFRFVDEAVNYEMDEKSGEFKLISVEHEGLINLNMSQLRACVGRISEALREALLEAVSESDGVE
jgi:hypothetical protein